MKSVNFQKKFETDLRKYYLPNVNTEAKLAGLVGVQYDRVIVEVDSTKDNKKTVYEHNGTNWVYINKVENIEHEITFSDEGNIYITDKDRKPKLMSSLLPYEDIDDLLDKDPAIHNKLYITKKGKLYFYNTDGAYKLVSGGGGAGGTNRLADVATKALIATTYPKPDNYDSVVVTADETHDGQTTWYYYNGTTWAYQGIYFPETVELVVSERNVRTAVIAPNVDYTIPIKYLVGNGHLEIYLEGEPLVKDVDYIEVGTNTYVSTKIQFKNTIPKEARITFKRVVSSYIGDSMISRMSAEGWLKYMNEAYNDMDDLILKNSLKLINAVLGSNISGILQDMTAIVMNSIYLDKTNNKLYRAKVSKSGTWTAGNTTDFYFMGLSDSSVNAKNSIDKAYNAKVTFAVNYTTKAITILDSYNIQSVVRTSQGLYRITFANPLPSQYPTFALTSREDNDTNECAYNARIARGYTYNTNYVDISYGYYTTGQIYTDPGVIALVAF